MLSSLEIILAIATIIGLASCASSPHSTLPSRNISSATEEIVGIFGDVHEDLATQKRVLQQMRERGVTHTIALGDFVQYSGLEMLGQALQMITPITGVTKERIFLAPGNWEHTQNNREAVNTVMSNFGNLVTPDYDSSGEFSIGAIKMRAGHFPQHRLPTQLLPPQEYQNSIPGQITIMETMPREHFPANGVVLDVFGHTHVGGIYFEHSKSLWVLNPGDVERKRKSPGEPQAYVIFYPRRGQLNFIDADANVSLLDVD
ncbi:MAG: metallophosphoesterase, partial [Proteobacteria bacterium]